MPVTGPSGGDFDLLLVGGGLQSALIALAVLDARPGTSVALFEAGAEIGGNHTWCFHAGDVPASASHLVEPLVVQRFAAYDVAFPGFERRIFQPYATITSDRLRDVVTSRLEASPRGVLYTHARAVAVSAQSVTLEDGREFGGRAVIDARGPERFGRELPLGYQKFLGLELLLEPGEAPPLELPLLMDARVPQTDGFRFFYLLPRGEHRLLVEDTYFSDTPALDRPALREGILQHARARGFRVSGVVREESGVLPLPVRGTVRSGARSPLVAGYAGGWFHPATGYSFPIALRLAAHVARHVGDASSLFGAPLASLERAHGKQFRFAAFLNRLLFTAFAPEDRFHALSRFYRLPEATIRRFYSLETTLPDRVRIVCGRPPRGLSLRAARTAVDRRAALPPGAFA